MMRKGLKGRHIHSEFELILVRSFDVSALRAFTMDIDSLPVATPPAKDVSAHSGLNYRRMGPLSRPLTRSGHWTQTTTVRKLFRDDFLVDRLAIPFQPRLLRQENIVASDRCRKKAIVFSTRRSFALQARPLSPRACHPFRSYTPDTA